MKQFHLETIELRLRNVEQAVLDLNRRVNACLLQVGGPTCEGHLTFDHIVKHVSVSYGIAVAHIMGTRRLERFVWPRHSAMYLCRKMLHASTTEIGAYFHCDHANIIHAVRHVEERISIDKAARKQLISVEARLANLFSPVSEAASPQPLDPRDSLPLPGKRRGRAPLQIDSTINSPTRAHSPGKDTVPVSPQS